MTVKYFDVAEARPNDGALVWIYTYQEHLNVAYYSESKKLFSNRGESFVDKFGECDVWKWAYAEAPDFESID